MKNSSFSINDIAAISVSMGPGSYTGLRIGVSFAKGLAMGLKIPIISVSTFDGLIAQVTDFFSSDFLFCPLIDARRNEVYTTIKCKNGEVIMPICCKILKDDSFFSILEQRRVVFFGSGAQKLPLSVTKNKNAILVEGILPNARGLFDISSKKFNAKNFEDINTFEPLYLKEFDRIIVKS